ncbi:MAG: hypothetical protein M3P51_14770 [Chloroflexota bacterium]|nr:hypothetical protein [Chloroflexota bacterium]
MVRHRHGGEETQGRAGRGDRPGRRAQKNLIERAYRIGERLGLAVWAEDEAGPYQAVPNAGSSWQPEGKPMRRPHEYVRGGTAKLLTLLHPKGGELRVKGVTSSANCVLHP